MPEDWGFKISKAGKNITSTNIADLIFTSSSSVQATAMIVKQGSGRSLPIARSEITRVANEGAIRHYEKGGIVNVQWVASFGPRTCPNCEALDGRIFETNDIPPLPLHTMCRCATIPVVGVA